MICGDWLINFGLIVCCGGGSVGLGLVIEMLVFGWWIVFCIIYLFFGVGSSGFY